MLHHSKQTNIGLTRRLLAASLLAAIPALPSQATDYVWKGDLSSDWIDSEFIPPFFSTPGYYNTNWNPDETSTLLLPGSDDSVIFDTRGGGGTVVMNGSVNVEEITFDGPDRYVLTRDFNSSRRLSLGWRGLKVFDGSTGLHSIGVDIYFDDTADWYIGDSGYLNYSGEFREDITVLTKTGAGRLDLTTSNYHAGTIVKAGSLGLRRETAIGKEGSNLTLHNLARLVALDSFVVSDDYGLVLNSGSGIIDTDTMSVTWDGDISGSGVLAKLGSGDLKLTGDNQHAGTAIQTGTLILGSGGAIGQDGASLTLFGGTTLGASNSFTIASTRNVFLGAGTVQIDTDGFTVNLAGQLIGTGNLEKVGSGVFKLSNNGNTNSNTIKINEGKIRVGHAAALKNNTVQINVDDGLDLAGFDARLGGLSGAGTLGLGTSDLSVGENNQDTTYSGVLSGGGLLTKTGSGTLELTANNQHAGTIVDQGALKITQASQLGTAGTDLTLRDGATLIAGGDFTASSGRSLILDSGQATIDTGGNALTWSGPLTGVGGFEKIGAGSLLLDRSNPFSGKTTITEGTITLDHASALKNSTVQIDVNDGLDLAGFNATLGGLAGSGTLGLGTSDVNVGSNGEDTTYSGVLSGGGLLTKTGNGTLELTANNQHAGTIVDQGAVKITLASQLGTAGTDLTLRDGATLIAGGDFTAATGRSLILDFGQAHIDTAGNDVTWSGELTGAGGFEKIGAGNLILDRSNTFTGATTISEGQVRLDHALALQSSTVQISIDDGLDLAGFNATLGGLAGAGDLDLSTLHLTVGGNGQSTQFSGDLTGNARLTKTGAGTLTLDGSSVELDQIDLLGGSIVFSGGTLDVEHFVGTLDQNGGTLEPGNSPGTTTITGDYNLNGGSVVIELAGLTPGSEHDVVSVGGALHLGLTSELDVQLIDAFTPNDGDQFDILDFSTVTGTFDTIHLPTLGGGLSWDTSSIYTDGSISVVPEPNSLALFGLGTLLIARRRR